jgi:hypothetical protein
VPFALYRIIVSKGTNEIPDKDTMSIQADKNVVEENANLRHLAASVSTGMTLNTTLTKTRRRELYAKRVE